MYSRPSARAAEPALSGARPRIETISNHQLTPAPGIEPIPGYRLIERLGRGGFGEVWKAEAPGGLHKAIKFVQGDMDAPGDSDLADQELKSLTRIKSIRHPYILSLERFDVIDGQLIIVMELADRNLWDRFRECKNKKLPGIPKDELIGYMEEAAEALDLMNGQYNLQHLDIKPQNLFLVYNHVKIADFGLVKDFEGKRGTITGGVTPVYAAPETFDGWVSRTSDQYSLAIVYQELLTGQRPFNGTLARQLVLQHLQAPPNVSSLPESDRAVVQRALSKKPDDRYKTCDDFVRALISGAGVGSGSIVVTTTPDKQKEGSDHTHAAHVPRVRDPKRDSGTQVRPRLEDAPENDLAVATMFEVDDPDVLVPAVVIGLGGVGNQVLRLFRRAMTDRFGAKPVPHIRLLAMDTDATALRALIDDQCDSLTADELFHAGLGRPSRYLRGDQVAGIDTWLGNSTLYRLPKNPGAAELRAFGRLAMLDHAATLSRRLRMQLDACRSDESLNKASRATRLGIRDVGPRVYIVAGLAGGTGGGMFIDAAYMARCILKQMGEKSPQVIGVLMLPPSERHSPPTALANCHAALTELHHFCLPKTTYSAQFEPKQPAVHDSGAPFERAMMLPLADPGDEKKAQAALGQASAWLLRELLTPVGAMAERQRDALATMTSQRSIAQTARTYQFAWPRERVARIAARHLGRDLLSRWISKDAEDCRENVTAWVEEQWQEKGLCPEPLADKINDQVVQLFGKVPLDQVERHIMPVAQFPPGEVTAELVHDAFDRIGHIMGPPDQAFFKGHIGRIVPIFEKIRSEIAVECDRAVADLVSRAVEEPGLRIVGAEEAAKQIAARAKQAQASYESLSESLLDEVADEARRLAQLILILDERKPPPKKREPMTQEILGLLRSYPKKQYQALLAKALKDVYQTVLGTMPDYLQEMHLCRERPALVLKELERRTSTEEDFDVALGPGRSLLPDGIEVTEDFAKRIASLLVENEITAADAHVQVQVHERFQGFVNFCLGNGPKPEHLADVLEASGTEYFMRRLAQASPAELLVDYDVDEVIKDALKQCRPPLAGEDTRDDELQTIVSTPDSPAGKVVSTAVSDALDGIGVAPCECKSDVVLYRELQQLRLTDLPQMGKKAREAYQKALADGSVLPHSRLDITWQPVARVA